MTAKKTVTTEKPAEYVAGAEAGYALRTAMANGTKNAHDALCNTVQRVKGFKLGLFGPGKTKEPKASSKVEVRMTPQLREWLSK